MKSIKQTELLLAVTRILKINLNRCPKGTEYKSELQGVQNALKYQNFYLFCEFISTF